MKYTGIVRNIDDLGRVTLPKELRDIRGIKAGDPVAIYVDGDAICIEKYKITTKECAICEGIEQLKKVQGVYICKKCGIEVANKFFMED